MVGGGGGGVRGDHTANHMALYRVRAGDHTAILHTALCPVGNHSYTHRFDLH